MSWVVLFVFVSLNVHVWLGYHGFFWALGILLAVEIVVTIILGIWCAMCAADVPPVAPSDEDDL